MSGSASSTVALAFCLSTSCAWAAAAVQPTAASAPAGDGKSVVSAYPGLASAGLTHAKLANLPKGTLLKAGGLTISEKELAEESARAPREVQQQLRRNGFFLLEQIATRKLVLQAAKEEAAKAGKDVSVAEDRDLIQAYLGKAVGKVAVSDQEVADFYRSNRDMFGGADLDAVRQQLGQYLLQQKQQEAVARHVETIGQRMPIEVSESWTAEQAVLGRDNPVDKARASGKPSLVDFGAKGCRPCDMLAPILEALKTKYAGKANVLFVSVREEQVLAARYGVRSIPVQVFFDRDGKEVFRHVGFYPQDQIEKKLAEIGVN